jgi:phosphohistidine phosphatase
MAEEKKLCLIRHGKSSWGYENVSDMDRPLKNRGIRNAYAMSSRLEQRGIMPELMISSPAIRALHSCLIMASELKYPLNQVRIEEILYFSEEMAIIDFIKKTTDAVSCLFIFLFY